MVLTGFCKAEDSVQMAVISWSIKMTLVGKGKIKKSCGCEMVPGLARQREQDNGTHQPAYPQNIPEGSCPSDQYFI